MIVFDLDGTLANCEHRRHFVDPTKDLNLRIFESKDKETPYVHSVVDPRIRKFQPDWRAFYDACDKDDPIQPVINIFCEYNDDEYNANEIQIWSGRCESVRDKTEKWLSKNTTFGSMNSTILKMRPIGDNTPDDQLKERWLDEVIVQGKKIDFVFDDRPKVVRMWRRRGIFVFNCLQGDHEF